MGAIGSFGSFVKKETLHIVRDVRTMLIALLIPIILMLLFGFAISVNIENLNVAVVAPNPTEAVRQQVERLSSNAYFTYCGAVGEGEANALLRRGEVDAVVLFAPDYDRRLALGDGPAVKILFDASNPNTASAGAAYVQGVLAQAATDPSGARAATAAPSAITRMLYNPQMLSAYNFVPGIMGMLFILICAIMTSVSIVREKESGTMEVLLVSPLRPMRIIVAKMVPYFMLSCIDLTIILLLAKHVLDVPMTGSVAAIVGVSLLYVALALALGLLISTLADRQSTALLVSAMVLLFPIIMLSGMMFPIENLPQVLQWLACIVPARWYIDAMRRLMIEGLPLSAVLDDVAILAAMTAAILAVALRKFNDKLD